MLKIFNILAVLITAWAIAACDLPKPYEYDFILSADTHSTVQGTGSMLPTITPTSTLYLNKVNSIEDIKINDIIYFYNQNLGKEVVHRCIYKINGGCITKGDNNPITDNYVVSFEDIKYKVIAIRYE